MKSYYLFVIVIASLLTSCSPRIGKVITKTYPASESGEDIEVFMDTRSAPSNSESLGVVSVTDGGFTTECDSFTVVNLLKEEARKAGGNAVVVTEYIKPSFWKSTCHQMIGTILRVYDFDSQLLAETADSAQLTEIKVINPARELPKITFSADFGYGWRGAKLNPDLSLAEKDYYKGLMSGWVGDASFNYYFNDHYGVGFIYSAYKATQSRYGTMQHDGGRNESGYLNTDNLIQFIGPTFLSRASIGNSNWILDCNLGIGYLGYSSEETFSSEIAKMYGSTVGMHLTLGAEYKMNKHWAISLRLSEIAGVLQEWTTETNGHKETVSVDDIDKGEGLGQLQVLFGIRYYIP